MATTARASTAVTVLWLAYLVALPFQRIWFLPWIGAKLQPPEVVFVALALVSVLLWMRERRSWRFVVTDVVPAAWLGASLLAFGWSSEPRSRDGLVETLGVVYLAALYVIVRATVTPRLLDRFGEWFGYAAAVAAALGIAGCIASYAGRATPLATVSATPIPYLGHAARAQGFTAGPQMLASVLLMAIPLFIGSRMARGWRRHDRVLLVLLVVGLGATVSKTGLCLAAALVVMWACASPSRARVRAAVVAWTTVAVLFVVGSHAMVLRQTAVSTLSAAQLVGGRPLASFEWRGDPWLVMPTTYLANNLASLVAIGRSWPRGVGPAGQPAFTSALQREGRFPASIWLITPHSTYLGTVAELGAAGLLALLLLIVAGGVTIVRLVARSLPSRWEAAACAGVGVAFLIEALSTDLLNCRHYWLLLAVMAARLAPMRLEREGGS